MREAGVWEAWSKLLATVSDCLLAHAWLSGCKGHLGMPGVMRCAVFWGVGMHVKADRSIQSNS